MRGALLRSGKSGSFTALGETGQPVYRAALQLREAIRRKNPELVDHLAIPQSDELGNRIDWYSALDGDVIPWSSATEEERAQPYLWRFWRHIPRTGRLAIFDRSWYGRVLVERVEGFAAEADWSRAFEEINAFEQEWTERAGKSQKRMPGSCEPGSIGKTSRLGETMNGRALETGRK